MIHFITFATHDNYLQAGERLTKQATNLKIFDNIKLHTLDNLKNDIIFWNQHKDFIENNIKGYGYWLWKPYLIKKEMDLLNDNDILLYLDSGCEIDILDKDNLVNRVSCPISTGNWVKLLLDKDNVVNCLSFTISTGNWVNLLLDKFNSVNCVSCPISTGNWVNLL